MFKRRKILYYILILLFICYAYFPLFLQLADLPIQLWDESLFAMRAYYLSRYGNLLANFDFFPGITYYPNLKPPLGTLFQALSYKLLGYSELSLRIPTVFFAIGLTGIFFFFKNDTLTKRILFGGACSIILLGSTGFIRLHVARTGDQETMILFFMFLQLMFFYHYYQTQEKKYWYLLSFAILASYLIKSIFAFFFLPAFLIFLLIKNQFLSLLKKTYTYYGIMIVILGIGIYYLVMENILPGFLNLEIQNIFGRFITIRDNQVLPPLHYVNAFVGHHFKYWTVPMLISGISVFFLQKSRWGDVLLLLWTCFIVLLTIISFSKTKLSWYDAPLYPLGALIISSTAFAFSEIKSNKKFYYLLICLILFISGLSYQKTIQAISTPQIIPPVAQYGPMLQSLDQKNSPYRKFIIYCYEFNGQVGFYSQLFNDLKNFEIDVIVYWQAEKLKVGTVMMACETEKKNRIIENYEVEILEEEGNCFLVKLLREK